METLAGSLRYGLAPLGIQSVSVPPGPFLTEVLGKRYQSENSSVFGGYGGTATARKNFAGTFNQMMGEITLPISRNKVADASKNSIEMPYNQRPPRTTADERR